MHILMGQRTPNKPREVIPGPIKTADDLFKVPDHIQRRIQRQLELEELQEFLRARGES